MPLKYFSVQLYYREISMILCRLFFLLLLALTILTASQACTILATVQDDHVLTGNNEDYNHVFTVV